MAVIFSFFHTTVVWKSTTKRDHAKKKNREINSLVNSFINTVISRKNVDFSVKIVIAVYSTQYEKFHKIAPTLIYPSNHFCNFFA